MSKVDQNGKIPNNVDLSSDKRLQRALEHWLPLYMEWWNDMGPVGFQSKDIYLRTAVSVEAGGWANFDYVKMPDYRWGIFLAPDGDSQRTIGFGDHYGKPTWKEIPGEYRGNLRRIIVTQADTEPASVEQQRYLGSIAPSLYDMRNLFQVNVEEGRHLWAMVYLLHRYFGRDGREEADEMLERHSGDPDNPRILGAFNEETPDSLSACSRALITLVLLVTSRSPSRSKPLMSRKVPCRAPSSKTCRRRAPVRSCTGYWAINRSGRSYWKSDNCIGFTDQRLKLQMWYLGSESNRHSREGTGF